LVVFTILTQTSVGIVLSLALLNLLYPGTRLSLGNGLSFSNPILMALLLVGLATLGSMLHLGNPKNAPRAISNLAGSWLSREIMAIGVYALALAVTFALAWKSGPDTSHTVFLAVSAAAAVALLWAMARVYMIPTIPPWNSWYTPLGFTATALSLGPLILLAMREAGTIGVPVPAADFLLGLVSAMLLIELISTPVHQIRLHKMETGIDNPVFDSGVFFQLYVTRIVILLAAALVILFFVVLPGAGNDPGAWVYPLLALVLAEEIIGRLLFYASYLRVGV
jgi:anaerobic dimethyl sulfoxide reductase subunit C (anchor subunit)